MSLAITVAVAKTHKYASRESGDSAEIAERPGGGVSVVVVDGQGSGRGARDLSMLLTGKALTLVKDGARDGVTARALNDFLLSYRHGQVSATLDLVSADVGAQALVVTRAGATAALIRHSGGVEVVPNTSSPLGRLSFTRPAVWQYPLEADVDVVVATDGIAGAGERAGLGPFDLVSFLQASVPTGAGAREIADALLAAALARDDMRPADDCTVAVLSVREHDESPLVRRLSTTIPLP